MKPVTDLHTEEMKFVHTIITLHKAITEQATPCSRKLTSLNECY